MPPKTYKEAILTDQTQHPRSNRHLRSILLVPAIVLGIAACGDDSESSSTTVAAAATAAPTTAAPATTAAPTTTAAPATTAAATTTTAAATETSAAAAPAAGSAVPVTESEFKIEGVSPTMTAGDYTFNVTNSGNFPHNLIINGPGVDNQKTENLTAGTSGSVTVTLQPGTYEFYCGVPTHKGKGMDLTVTVA